MDSDMNLANMTMEIDNECIEIEITEIKQEPFDCEAALVERECVICDKVVENQDFLSHMVMHAKEKPHKCLGCEKAFRKESSLLSHMKNYHRTDKFFQCQKCPRVFKCNSDLIRHALVHTGEKPFKCSHCDKAFNQKGNLKIHESTCLKPANEPEKPKVDAPKQCQVCHKVLATSQTLSQHMLIHTNEKPHECSYCHKHFRIKKTLAKHVMAIHEPTENWKSNPWDKECSICKKMFKSGSDLKRHNLVHTGEKPFECSHCNYRFGQKSSLTQHLLICPSNTNPLSSVTSPKNCVPSKCSTCKKVFTNLEKLKRHMLVHTGERPHQCTICGSRFRLKHHLAAHERRVHHGLPTKGQEASNNEECKPPASIAKLFQRCGVLLERMPFIDDVAAKLRVHH